MARPKEEAREKKRAFDEAFRALGRKQYADTQSGKLGVDLPIQVPKPAQSETPRPDRPAQCPRAATAWKSRGVWIDEGFDAKMTLVTPFKAPERCLLPHPGTAHIVKDVYRLGNQLSG